MALRARSCDACAVRCRPLILLAFTFVGCDGCRHEAHITRQPIDAEALAAALQPDGKPFDAALYSPCRTRFGAGKTDSFSYVACDMAQGSAGLLRAPVGGGATEVLASGGLHVVAFAAAPDRIVWIGDRGRDREYGVFMLPTSAKSIDAAVLIMPRDGDIGHPAITTAGRDVLWVQRGPHGSALLAHDGKGPVRTVTTTAGEPSVIAPMNSDIVYDDSSMNGLFRVPLGGGAPIRVSEGLAGVGAIQGIAATRGHVYWSTRETGLRSGQILGAGLWRVPRLVGEPERVASLLDVSGPWTVIDRVCWAEQRDSTAERQHFCTSD